MKIPLIFTITLGLILIGCSEKQSGQLSAMLKAHKIKAYSTLPLLHITQSDSLKYKVTKADGIHPITYFGDTIGYQFYKEGIAHGPFYETYFYIRKKKDKMPPDGCYKNGKKHGYFYRYSGRNIYQPDYISYYKNDELLWADVYDRHAYPKEPYFIQNKSVSIKAKKPNGKKWFEGTYKKSKAVGIHTYYNNQEKIAFRINWTDSVLYSYRHARDTFSIIEKPFTMEDIQRNSERANRLRIEYVYKG